MRKYLMYLIIYSIGGFILERFINFFAYYENIGNYESVIDYIIRYDNSVLFGPYQPLYGVGVVLAILIWDKYLIKDSNKTRSTILLLLVAIITTGLSEAFHGYGFEFLTGQVLWDYTQFFPCQIPYVCVYPTSLFGIASFLVIRYIHPYIIKYVEQTPRIAKDIAIAIITLDLIITLIIIL